MPPRLCTTPGCEKKNSHTGLCSQEEKHLKCVRTGIHKTKDVLQRSKPTSTHATTTPVADQTTILSKLNKVGYNKSGNPRKNAMYSATGNSKDMQMEFVENETKCTFLVAVPKTEPDNYCIYVRSEINKKKGKSTKNPAPNDRLADEAEALGCDIPPHDKDDSGAPQAAVALVTMSNTPPSTPTSHTFEDMMDAIQCDELKKQIRTAVSNHCKVDYEYALATLNGNGIAKECKQVILGCTEKDTLPHLIIKKALDMIA